MTELAAESRPFVMLTQNDCPQCERLKLMLEKPLRGQFGSQIRAVHRQEQAEEFSILVEQYGIQTTPALLHLPSGRVLLNTGGLGEVKSFLMGS
ncbi:thioredoxin fold domain-containing protein [Deinococcus oregonensis]|uniref:Thioredoxin fold domain-containing protein n=1 Tax=Deinococcus oregonensis TaxID=1805970 RepID=A0ABV6B1T4_9DEIO